MGTVLRSGAIRRDTYPPEPLVPTFAERRDCEARTNANLDSRAEDHVFASKVI